MVKNIILVSGKLQSGKNAFTDMLIEELKPTGKKLGFDFFSKSVKDQSKDIFKNLIDYLNSISEEYNIPELKTEDENWYENKNKIARILLQTYGTNIFRDMIDENHWGKILKRRVCADRTEDFLFITDVRFKSEIETISDKTSFKHDRRTITPNYNILKIRINRNTFERTDDPIFTHDSELNLDDYSDWDMIVNNDSSLEDLRIKSKQVARFILEKTQKNS
jgi:hypothetical protein